MPTLTLENLASRLEAVEKQLAEQKTAVPIAPKKDWRNLVGTMEDNEFTRDMLKEIEAIREAERAEARSGKCEEMTL